MRRAARRRAPETSTDESAAQPARASPPTSPPGTASCWNSSSSTAATSRASKPRSTPVRSNRPLAQQIFDACRFFLGEDSKLDFGRLLAAFDDADTKSLLVELDESCATQSQGRPRPLARRPRRNRTIAATTKLARRRTLAAAQQNTGDAEQLLAQFLEQAKSKHRTEYERRKK